MGIPGPTGVMVGIAGVVGVTGAGVGAGGDIAIPPGAFLGDSAAMLLVRNESFDERAFNGCVPASCKPPAAGSISSAHAPQLCTESVYAVSSVAAKAFVDKAIDAVSIPLLINSRESAFRMSFVYLILYPNIPLKSKYFQVKVLKVVMHELCQG